MVTIIVAMLIIGSCLVSTLIIAASMLSSRFKPCHPIVEEYEAEIASQLKRNFTPCTYPVEF